ncbi:MAG TPA: PilX N-terminal domain-containing pilus assembly protein [Thermomonas sp.]|nr:PilX N-terminal domain-containing pilus assembly protein [Thermomonas sp.]
MSKLVQPPAPSRRQQGVSLLVVLILLLVMSVLGIAVLRSSAMQERMSANMVDRNQAVQAAETGLIVAQTTVIKGTFNNMWNGSQTFTALRTAAGLNCAGGYCDRSDPANAATWQTAPSAPAAWTTMANGARYGFTVEYLGNAKGESSEVRGVCNTSSAPRYLCERPMFRVTSYGRGRGVAQVVLQSNIISQPQ